ncbi:MAG: hypothetical protein FK731_05385 [Asgard group archaeon]|nr:hypothetical protein [Asgard group archaeon]
MLSEKWKLAQKEVACFLKDHGFAIQEEVRLQNETRMDILALKKIGKKFYHIIVEVKDWGGVSRKKEMEFCKQITSYLIQYSLEKILLKNPKNKWERKKITLNDQFIGILCLTKDAHFSYRKVSDHFFLKHKRIRGIPLREQIAKTISLYVTRFDFLPKVFQELQIPLHKETKIFDYLE